MVPKNMTGDSIAFTTATLCATVSTMFFQVNSIVTPKQLFLITEYASGGELFDYIVKK